MAANTNQEYTARITEPGLLKLSNTIITFLAGITPPGSLSPGLPSQDYAARVAQPASHSNCW